LFLPFNCIVIQTTTPSGLSFISQGDIVNPVVPVIADKPAGGSSLRNSNTTAAAAAAAQDANAIVTGSMGISYQHPQSGLSLDNLQVSNKKCMCMFCISLVR
jgi:hypothetical protein